MTATLNVAVIGAGISGIASAVALTDAGCAVTVFESADDIGGHAHSLRLSSGTVVDTSFMVYNDKTYPNLAAFFVRLGIVTQSAGDMSIGVRTADGHELGTQSVSTMMTSLRNARLVVAFRRFQKAGSAFLAARESCEGVTFGQFLKENGISAFCRTAVLEPLCCASFSCSTKDLDGFSAVFALTWLSNHGFLGIGVKSTLTPDALRDNISWRMVKGGSRVQYKEHALPLMGTVKLGCAVTSVANAASGDVVVTDSTGASSSFDHVVLACHPPEALALLDAGQSLSDEQRRLLSAVTYRKNRIVVHRDPSVMPARKALWSCWNFTPAGITYYLNMVQRLDSAEPDVFVTVNPSADVVLVGVIAEWTTSHPTPTVASLSAVSKELPLVQGVNGICFASASFGFGFHEDGFVSGVKAAHAVLRDNAATTSWDVLLPPSDSSMTLTASRKIVAQQLQAIDHPGDALRIVEGGAVERCRAGDESVKPLTINVLDERFWSLVVLEQDVGFAEAYIQGYFELWNCHLFDVLALVTRSARGFSVPALSYAAKMAARVRHHVKNANTVDKTRVNISAHYDLSNDMYACFLDPSMTYSCAFFEHPHATLEEAQRAKLGKLLDSARLSDDSRVLEVGFGWGSLALLACERYGCTYTGITQSSEQLAWAQRLVDERGLGDRVSLHLADYRVWCKEHVGAYDRILSCEMLEAVGRKYLPTYFEALDAALVPGGVVVIQSITKSSGFDAIMGSGEGAEFLQTYIFPGGHLPSFREISAALQRSSLVQTSVESQGEHYALTLQLWRQNFVQQLDTIMSLGFDDGFCRTFYYYFTYCQAMFQTRTWGNHRIVFVKEEQFLSGGSINDTPVHPFRVEDRGQN